MVKFDEKGQGFWDFVTLNCSAEFVEKLERKVRFYERYDDKFDYNLHVLENGCFVSVYFEFGGRFDIFVHNKESGFVMESSISSFDLKVINEVFLNG